MRLNSSFNTHLLNTLTLTILYVMSECVKELEKANQQRAKNEHFSGKERVETKINKLII